MRLSALLLLGLTLPALAAQPKKRPEDAVRGEQLWDRSCWHCHGESARGDGPAAAAFPDGVPDLTGRVTEPKYDDLVDVILYGAGDMPAFHTEMDKRDARRILVFLNQLDDDPPEDDSDQDGDEESDDDQPTDEADTPSEDVTPPPEPEGQPPSDVEAD